jgi:hypothetical protein
MDWAVYKRCNNALKRHLAFALNRLIPVQFVCTDANGKEREMRAALREAGVTYIADRIALFEQITQQQAFFSIRIKKNSNYTLNQCLAVHGIPESWQPLLSEITDSLIFFPKTNKKTSIV